MVEEVEFLAMMEKEKGLHWVALTVAQKATTPMA